MFKELPLGAEMREKEVGKLNICKNNLNRNGLMLDCMSNYGEYYYNLYRYPSATL